MYVNSCFVLKVNKVLMLLPRKKEEETRKDPDDAEILTSEVHDPYARTTGA